MKFSLFAIFIICSLCGCDRGPKGNKTTELLAKDLWNASRSLPKPLDGYTQTGNSGAGTWSRNSGFLRYIIQLKGITTREFMDRYSASIKQSLSSKGISLSGPAEQSRDQDVSTYSFSASRGNTEGTITIALFPLEEKQIAILISLATAPHQNTAEQGAAANP